MSMTLILDFYLFRVRGRHRGLPVAVDRAVLLPSDLVIRNTSGNAATPSVNGNVKEPVIDDLYSDKPPQSPNLLLRSK